MTEQTKYYVAFSYFLGIGPIKFKQLINRFGNPKNAYEADSKQLIKVLGEKLAQKFINFRKEFKADSILQQLFKKNIQVLTLEDNDYPNQLRQISDPPICLYVIGNKKILSNKNNIMGGESGGNPANDQLDDKELENGKSSVVSSHQSVKPLVNKRLPEENFQQESPPKLAIVGTRKPTNYGLQIAEKFASELVDYGFTIVSGMALGIDSAAHWGAIKAGGKTIAVLGCGVDIIYPPANKQLYQKIIENNGCIISEFPPGHTVLKGLFIARNRIIAGLSQGVLVVEGAKDSGALITARYAAEQGRDVFAPPSPITSPLSEAPNLLLKQGAKIVTSIFDILEEYQVKIKIKDKQLILDQLQGLEKEIIEAILTEPKTADELALSLKKPISQILNCLSLLEIKGLIKKDNQGRFYNLEMF